jgi:hypothetical protein
MSDSSFLEGSLSNPDNQAKAIVDVAAAAGGGPAGEQPAADAAAAGRCLSNTYPQNSPDEEEGRIAPHHYAGGLDWFEWSSAIEWDRHDFEEFAKRLDRIKDYCQKNRKPFEWIDVTGVGPIRVARTGGNRGGDRGQHFDYKLRFQDYLVFLAARSNAEKKHPNLWVRLSGRDCLLHGASEAYACVEGFVEALGGKVVDEKLTRADFALDIANLEVGVLQEAVERRQFITRAASVDPKWDVLHERKTGFTAGKCPLHMTVYDKTQQLIGREDHLYVQAMIDRRWGGELPYVATRIEFQCSRPWLMQNGVSSPQDFFRLQGSIIEKLTGDWFRLTDRPVDRKHNNQSRADTLPAWAVIQEAFRRIYGRPEGELVPVRREKIQPSRLIKQARGCLRNALLQMGWKCRNYREFLHHAGTLLDLAGMTARDQVTFIEDFARMETEYRT